jgi:hypothetical protein
MITQNFHQFFSLLFSEHDFIRRCMDVTFHPFYSYLVSTSSDGKEYEKYELNETHNG